MKKFNPKLSVCFSFGLRVEDDPLTGISTHIVVRNCSKDEDGTIYLTPDCVTPEEFEYHIDRLQSELNTIRKRGARAFIEAINGYKRVK